MKVGGFYKHFSENGSSLKTVDIKPTFLLRSKKSGPQAHLLLTYKNKWAEPILLSKYLKVVGLAHTLL